MNQNQLYRYFDGIATPEEGKEVKRWIEASAENREAFLRERRLFDALLMHSDTDPKEEPHQLFHHSYWKGWKWLKVAALLLLGIGSHHAYLMMADQEPDMQTTIRVPAGQRTFVTLPDGTGVWLNARSEMSYSTSFNQRQREVSLRGEAFFNVAKNEQLPFVVRTSTFGIEATGTQLNVEDYPGHQHFEAALMEGGIQVYRLSHPKDRVCLSPLQKVYWENGQLKVVALDHLEDYRWRDGLICFRNESFFHIMLQFQKSFGIRIHIHNQEVMKHTYTGKFRMNDGVDYALRVLQRDIRFRFKKDDEKETIDIY